MSTCQACCTIGKQRFSWQTPPPPHCFLLFSLFKFYPYILYIYLSVQFCIAVQFLTLVFVLPYNKGAQRQEKTFLSSPSPLSYTFFTLLSSVNAIITPSLSLLLRCLLSVFLWQAPLLTLFPWPHIIPVCCPHALALWPSSLYNAVNCWRGLIQLRRKIREVKRQRQTGTKTDRQVFIVHWPTHLQGRTAGTWSLKCHFNICLPIWVNFLRYNIIMSTTCI